MDYFRIRKKDAVIVGMMLAAIIICLCMLISCTVSNRTPFRLGRDIKKVQGDMVVDSDVAIALATQYFWIILALVFGPHAAYIIGHNFKSFRWMIDTAKGKHKKIKPPD